MTVHADVASALHAARRSRTPIAPLTETHPGLTVDDAYAIQQRFVDLLRDEGGSVVGWKLGLTSKPMQEMLGVYQPDFAPLVSSMVHDDGAELDLGDFIQPRVEAEIALVLGAELAGPEVGIAEAAAAVAGAYAAIEVVDSRVVDWRIRFVDTVADLASCGAVVTGREPVAVDFDLRLCGMVISKNGEMAATGAGAATLGDPLAALAWLAGTVSRFGSRLEAGHIVMTGSLHAAFPVAPGDEVVAEFDRLGTATVRFAGSTP